MSFSRGGGKQQLGYDKYSEHNDSSPLGKLQQQYWTTKQQVIRKLGKKEDEFVVMSDSELDAKLDLFEAIEENSVDLLRVIEMYQDKIIVLSIEEGEMGRFLKSQSTYDNKTRAGKMMAAVGKAQNFASQQRTALRLPLVRLYNEVETFRFRAVADTWLTVRRMENARTEYRGALLWMRNVSQELDPDTSKKLEKFRRVQAQVKKTKTKFDRLKTDVIQKIDLLSASRCNMFSHVLVQYQQTLIQFWEKTARTMNAVADAFKGYQYYEFNVIKDLVEPSKRLAKLANKSGGNDDDKSVDSKATGEDEEKASTLIDFETANETTSETSQGADGGQKTVEDEVNELIDLMTRNEATNLNEQMKELEKLEMEKKLKNSSQPAGSKKPESTSSSFASKFSLDSFGLSSKSSATAASAASNPQSTDSAEMTANASANFQAFKDMFTNANDEFEREWQSAFTSGNAEATSNAAAVANLSPSQTEFGFFTSAGAQSSSLFAAAQELMKPMSPESLSSKSAAAAEPPNQPTQPLAAANKQSTTAKNLEAWYNLFAELDPLKNPDAIGQKEGTEEERNC